jgi:hypothetical protein
MDEKEAIDKKQFEEISKINKNQTRLVVGLIACVGATILVQGNLSQEARDKAFDRILSAVIGLSAIGGSAYLALDQKKT